MKKIVLIDLWTDSNKGDCALQLGLIRMLRNKYPNAELVGIFRFGQNEFDLAFDEVGYTVSELDRYYGGLRDTQYAADHPTKYSGIAHKLISFWSFIKLACLMFVYMAGLKFLLPSRRREVLNEISQADVVVWKGKNFREYGGISGVNRQATLTVAGYIGRLLNENIHCVNASIWNMSNPFEKWIVRFILSKCKSVSVRERSSLAQATNSMKLSNVFMAHDLSFYYLLECRKNKIPSPKAANEREYVALTITNWGGGEEVEHYTEALYQSIIHLSLEHSVRSFVIVPQVTRVVENSDVLVHSLIKRLKSTNRDLSISVIDKAMSIDELLVVYSNAKLLIGTRMHSCVFARSVQTPFIALAYDHGAKWDILKEIWPSKYVQEYTVNPEVLKELIDQLLMESDTIFSETDSKLPHIFAESFNNIKYI